MNANEEGLGWYAPWSGPFDKLRTGLIKGNIAHPIQAVLDRLVTAVEAEQTSRGKAMPGAVQHPAGKIQCYLLMHSNRRTTPEHDVALEQ